VKKYYRSWHERNFIFKVMCWSLAAGIPLAFFFFSFLQDSFAYSRLERKILSHLCKRTPLPTSFAENADQGRAVIYVMGGAQTELSDRFQTAAGLYRRLKPLEILILNIPGITRYEPSLHRNLTNYEWATMKLTGLGIDKASIHPISCSRRFFGTFSEAKCVSSLAFKGGYRDVVVVTSPYHTMRAWLAFDRFLRGSGMRLYIYPSKKVANLKYLVVEEVKLFFYKYLLIPIYFHFSDIHSRFRI
jgi:DUF218 domain